MGGVVVLLVAPVEMQLCGGVKHGQEVVEDTNILYIGSACL